MVVIGETTVFGFLWFRTRKTCFWFLVMICVEMLECQFCAGAFVYTRIFFYSVYSDQQYSKKRLAYHSESRIKPSRYSRKPTTDLQYEGEINFFKLNHRILGCHCNIIYFMIKLDWPVHSVLLLVAGPL